MESEREGKKRLTGGDSGAVSELPPPPTCRQVTLRWVWGEKGELL